MQAVVEAAILFVDAADRVMSAFLLVVASYYGRRRPAGDYTRMSSCSKKWQWINHPLSNRNATTAVVVGENLV
jgi:hypothetical protein